jgi:hypothetical protein
MSEADLDSAEIQAIKRRKARPSTDAGKVVFWLGADGENLDPAVKARNVKGLRGAVREWRHPVILGCHGTSGTPTVWAERTESPYDEKRK